jgi:hypothetical protein
MFASNSSRRAIVVPTFVLCGIFVAGLGGHRPAFGNAPAAKQRTNSAKGVSPSKISLSAEGAKVLDPDQFGSTAVKHGYQLARANPTLAKQLFCYCGCDLTESHKTILDCYTDKNKHAADCHECIDELVSASQLQKTGKSIAYIQHNLHQKWAQQYPFSEPTQAYKDFLARAHLKFAASALAEPLSATSAYSLSSPKTASSANSNCCDKTANKKQATESSADAGKPVKPGKPKFEFPPEGPSAMAADAVKKYPELIAKIPCYCGCSESQSHTSLLDCFSSNEAPECSVCLEEAAIVGKMHSDGATDDAIKTALEQMYKRP